MGKRRSHSGGIKTIEKPVLKAQGGCTAPTKSGSEGGKRGVNLLRNPK